MLRRPMRTQSLPPESTAPSGGQMMYASAFGGAGVRERGAAENDESAINAASDASAPSTVLLSMLCTPHNDGPDGQVFRLGRNVWKRYVRQDARAFPFTRTYLRGIKYTRFSVILLFVLYSHEAWQAHHRAKNWRGPRHAASASDRRIRRLPSHSKQYVKGVNMWRILLIAGMIVTIGNACAATDSLHLTKPEASIVTQDITHRRALVIGNAQYGEHPLEAASRDADDMSAALFSIGFEVTRRTNLNEADMRRTLDAFAAQLAPRDIALVYFAGHGVQAGGDARLLSLDAHQDKPVTLIDKSIALKEIVERMARGRKDGTNIVVLDMCLDGPFENVPVFKADLPSGTLVAYAAAPGAQAVESRQNGRYTAALLRTLSMHSGVTTRAFDDAAALLGQSSQRPWIASTLKRDVVLSESAARLDIVSASPETAAGTRGILPKDSNEQYELTFWESIKDSTYPSDYEAYLKAYPNGRFATLAKARIERLHATASAVAKPAASAPKPIVASAPVAPAKPPQPAMTAAAIAPKPAATKITGHEIKDCPSCPVLIPITPGTFTMGSNNDDPAEKPPHRVTLAHSFAIGKYAVTVEQWNACVDAGACTRIASDAESSSAPPANSPMRNVSWDDAQVYVKWLSKLGGKPYRLPTEAEWEYAARGGTQGTYWWGDQFKKGMADCKDCGDPYRAEAPTPVGSFAANPYGLFDMNGSVWEWVADCWHSSYKGAPADGRMWDDASCSVRVIRGGSWREGSAYMQSATRFKYSSSVRQSQNGFRVVRDEP
jgi:formylglycine-generating enzyme required for sulfatase activity